MSIDLFSIVLIAFGLSADCFAVALSGGISSKNQSFTKISRVALSFGLFQALMPLIGWLVGSTIINVIAGFDHWVAFALLGFVGGKMLFESVRPLDESNKVTDISRGWALLTLSVATSIDAMAVGLSFALLEVNIGLASLIIGVVAMAITVVGFWVGKRAGKVMGKRAETFGGLILLFIAFRILYSHLT
jgi:putative Mn2+ efflux pump MntP